jgi:aspartate kinase
MNMKILKFGGTSVGSAANVKTISDIIKNERAIVVLSAISGTTNAFERMIKYKTEKNHQAIGEEFQTIRNKYLQITTDLIPNSLENHFIIDELNLIFDQLYTQLISPEYPFDPNALLAQGELITTQLFVKYWSQIGFDVQLIPALNFMRTNKDAEPDYFYIKENVNKILMENSETKLFITQGYICRDDQGNISNLGRGGSDYTATILGAVTQAKEVQIWTDVNGLHNNDPRFVEGTKSVRYLNYKEAEELAYFGAKVLHASCIRPIEEANIPVRLKNTMNPEDKGTLITQQSSGYGIKAIAARDQITGIRIKSGRMLMAYGFLRKVFEIFDEYKTPVDLVTTSEVTISVSIDKTDKLQQIRNRLLELGEVEIYENQSIICLVGEIGLDDKGLLLGIGQGLKNIPVRMISYGASNNNLSLLVETENKVSALQALNQSIFHAYV